MLSYNINLWYHLKLPVLFGLAVRVTWCRCFERNVSITKLFTTDITNTFWRDCRYSYTCNKAPDSRNTGPYNNLNYFTKTHTYIYKTIKIKYIKLRWGHACFKLGHYNLSYNTNIISVTRPFQQRLTVFPRICWF